MAITADTLRWYRSERMTDEDDGGGQMSGTEIVPGQENQVFDDLSDVDRAAGDVSIRKVYAAVASNDDDKYLDAGVLVLRPPADPTAAVTLFSTGDYYDERAALRERLESGITRGGLYMGWLWGDHIQGQRAVVLWQRTSVTLPSTGQRLELVARNNGVTEHSQVLWITRVVDELVERHDANGPYQVRSVTCEISGALREDYTGIEPQRYDPTGQTTTGTALYDTRYNPEAVPMYGIQPVIEQAAVGEASVKVASLFSHMIPTAFAETPIPDTVPGGDCMALVRSNDGTAAFSTTLAAIKPGATLYLGTPCFPGTVAITIQGDVITDDGATLRRAGVDIGTIDYSNGICFWNDACPNYGTATKTVTWAPAAAPIRVADTASQLVTVENRGFVWVMTLAPIPSPGTLRVAYRANDAWYVLADQGGGVLSGADSSYGSGTLNFSTGTVTLTTGALPDPESDILYAWATPVSYRSRGGTAVPGLKISRTADHAGIVPGSFSVSWGAHTLSDDGHGLLTGTGGTGTLRYATGEWEVTPTTIPAVGAEFLCDYDWGDPMSEDFAHPAREPNGSLRISVDHEIVPGSVEVTWNTLLLNYDPNAWTQFQGGGGVDPIQTARDNGQGGLPISGGTNGGLGTVDYTGKTLQWTPDVTLTIPSPTFRTVQLGTHVLADGETQAPTWRTTFLGWEYIPTGANYPPDESGWVNVKYRTPGGATTVADERHLLDAITLDLTPGYAERVVPGSLRFLFGGSTYVNTAGVIYRNPSPETGAGTLAGSLNVDAGTVTLTSWPEGGANTVTLQALLTAVGGQPVDLCSFRIPVSPVKAGTLQLRWVDPEGSVFSKIPDGSGVLEDGDCTLRADWSRGIVHVRFGRWRTLASLTADDLQAAWYTPNAVVNIGGVDSIWHPHPILADTLIYNAVAATYLPPDSDILGLDAARLPPDGKALIYRTGMLALIHNTATLPKAELIASEVIDCGRTRLYRVVIEDSNDQRLTADLYSVNREQGLVTMADPLDLSGYAPPFFLRHTVADLQRLLSTDINGRLTFLRPVSHSYPVGSSYVSGMLFIGTLQARYFNLFEQASWSGQWSDDRIGDQPLASYNDALYPIGVTNAGAYPDRFLVRFTSATAFQIVGEHLGLIGVGTVNEDCAPQNPRSGVPYFTLLKEGWGGGWATGNCLRFNLTAACYPVDAVRAIQPSDPTGLPDSVELLLIGNVDA